MKKINEKNLLSREQLKSVKGGLKDVNDGCPDGLTEWNCVTGGGGLDGLIYLTYCLPPWEPSPCGAGPS